MTDSKRAVPPDGSHPADRRTDPSTSRPLWVAAGVLLAVGIVLPLLVGLYAHPDPTVLGFPFYYWFQFLMIPVTAVLTYVAYRLTVEATRRDRVARGLPADPTDPHPTDAGTQDGGATARRTR